MPRKPQAGLPARDPAIAIFLEDIYSSCAKTSRLVRDPLAVVASYPKAADRELAGLVASTLAFGSVDLILRAVREALAPLGQDPRDSLLSMTERDLGRAWKDFQYRYCFAKDLTALMRAARLALLEAGSLESFFLGHDEAGSPDIVPAAGAFARALKDLAAASGPPIRPNLLPEPEGGSACKRLFLYLRWMVRDRDVDLGCWKGVGASRLVVPMDTHMARVCAERLGFIPKPKADLGAALAVTAAFRLYDPEDPVKYDFALTRPGIDPLPGDERFACS